MEYQPKPAIEDTQEIDMSTVLLAESADTTEQVRPLSPREQAEEDFRQANIRLAHETNPYRRQWAQAQVVMTQQRLDAVIAEDRRTATAETVVTAGGFLGKILGLIQR